MVLVGCAAQVVGSPGFPCGGGFAVSDSILRVRFERDTSCTVTVEGGRYDGGAELDLWAGGEQVVVRGMREDTWLDAHWDIGAHIELVGDAFPIEEASRDSRLDVTGPGSLRWRDGTVTLDAEYAVGRVFGPQQVVLMGRFAGQVCSSSLDIRDVQRGSAILWYVRDGDYQLEPPEGVDGVTVYVAGRGVFEERPSNERVVFVEAEGCGAEVVFLP